MRKRLGRLMVALGVIAAGVASANPPAGAVVDDPDIDTAATYEYLVDTDANSVGVTIALAVTADKPNRSSGAGVYQYYFTGYVLPIPEDATGVWVTDDADRPLNITVDTTTDGFDVLEIEFRKSIYYRQTANLLVSFTLPHGAARTDGASRVNGAYIGFSSWVAPRLEAADVAITLPAGFFDHSYGSDSFFIERDGDEVRFRVTDIDPENYWSVVSLSRDEALTSTEISIDGNDFRVQSWPGDAVWSAHVTDNLDAGLPELIETVGVPWPVDGELTIVESFSPFLEGYGGWYDAASREIEIGDELDDHLVFHELSHVWFNEQLFTKRWITEGLADEIGAAVVASIGGDAPEPTRSSMLDSAAQPLNTWSDFTSDRDTEGWSYGASWTVTHEIVDVIGLEAMSLVIQASADDEIAYLGDSEVPEPGRTSKDWRLYLDLIENRGAVDDDRIADLFTDWVLTSAEAGELADRSEARAAYRELVAAGDDWAPPLAVRTAMSDWQFVTATDLIEASRAVVDQRDELIALLDGLDGSLPSELELAYEGADGDLEASADAMSEATTTVRRLDGTRRNIDGADGLLQRLGSIGHDLDADLAAAVDAFEAGDDEQANEQAERIDDDVDGLSTTGAIRLSVVLALIVMLGVAFVSIRRTKGRARPPTIDGAEDEEADDHASEQEPAHSV